MSLLLTAPFLLTLTLLVSGLAKLGARRATEDAMTSLRLPRRDLHRPVATALPVLEIVLALVLWVPLVPLQLLTAAVILLLMLTYLVIIARALSFDEEVECSCFGSLASPTVSRLTLGRNLVLSMLALVTLLAAGGGLLTIAVVQTPLVLLSLGGSLLLTIMLTMLTIGGTTQTAAEADAAAAGSSPAPTAGAPAADATAGTPADAADGPGEDEELLDYERAPIPPAVLQQSDGQVVTLTQLTAQQAALLLFVTEGCGPCERVLDQVPGWIETLSPYLQVAPVFSRPLDRLRSRTTERVGTHALHDPQFIARTALGGHGAPSAVLLGADGLLAGGPVTGGEATIAFVADIQEQLQIAQDEGELPTAP